MGILLEVMRCGFGEGALVLKGVAAR